MQNDFDKMLNFDGLAEAEKITGQSYKNDPETMNLGLLMMLRNAGQRQEELALRDDAYYGMPMDDYLGIIKDQGFEVILEVEHQYEHDQVQYFLWRDGILLITDDYHGKVNGATMYFNLEFKEYSDTSKLHLSGHLNSDLYDQDRYVWVGNLDVREAVVHSLNYIQDLTTVLDPWVEAPWMGFLVNDQYKLLTKDEQEQYKTKVIEQFPADVQVSMKR